VLVRVRAFIQQDWRGVGSVRLQTKTSNNTCAEYCVQIKAHRRPGATQPPKTQKTRELKIHAMAFLVPELHPMQGGNGLQGTVHSVAGVQVRSVPSTLKEWPVPGTLGGFICAEFRNRIPDLDDFMLPGFRYLFARMRCLK